MGVALLACLAAWPFTAPADATPREVERVTIGNWQGNAYVDPQSGRFTHCAVTVSYVNGVFLSLTVDASMNFRMALLSRSWRLEPGATYPLSLWLDRQRPLSYTATASTTNQVRVDLSDSDWLFQRFRRAYVLYVQTVGTRFDFSLRGSSRALRWLRGCAQTNRGRLLASGNPFAADPNPFAAGGATGASSGAPPAGGRSPRAGTGGAGGNASIGIDLSRAAPAPAPAPEAAASAPPPDAPSPSNAPSAAAATAPGPDAEGAVDTALFERDAAIFLANILSAGAAGPFEMFVGDGPAYAIGWLDGGGNGRLSLADPAEAADPAGLRRRLVAGAAARCDGSFGSEALSPESLHTMAAVTTCTRANGTGDATAHMVVTHGSIGVTLEIVGEDAAHARERALALSSAVPAAIAALAGPDPAALPADGAD